MAIGGQDSGRRYTGPLILAQGFRPFFLSAGVWAVLAMALWIATFALGFSLPSAFDGRQWHVHEVLFGFFTAAMTGFVLTAIPNWTGRLPVRGWPLGLLWLAWFLGRVAVFGSDLIGAWPAMAVDLVFLIMLEVLVLREIVVGRNWRNLPIGLAPALLAAANLAMHLEAAGAADTGEFGQRLGFAVAALLIALIGGRIVPSFTRNWLVKQGVDKLPAPFGRLDRLALGSIAVGLVAWLVAPDAAATAILLLLAGVLNVVRVGRWQGQRTAAEPLVWILHLGYCWLGVAILLLGLSVALHQVPASAALHALGAGAITTMVVAVMTRASLGHSGRPLTAGRGTQAVYILILAAGLIRVWTAFHPAASDWILWVAALLWCLGWLAFVVVYVPILGLRQQGN